MIYAGEKPEALAHYSHLIELPVLWGDMDSVNHVNNTRYFRYQETARIEFFRTQMKITNQNAEVNMEQSIALAETRCRFKVSLTYPDTILVGSAVANIEKHQFLIKHEIYSHNKGFIVAEGDARMVHYDFEKGNKLEIQGDFLKNLQSLQLP